MSRSEIRILKTLGIMLLIPKLISEKAGADITDLEKNALAEIKVAGVKALTLYPKVNYKSKEFLRIEKGVLNLQDIKEISLVTLVSCCLGLLDDSLALIKNPARHKALSDCFDSLNTLHNLYNTEDKNCHCDFVQATRIINLLDK